MVLNFDGASRGNSGLSGAGGIIRDHTGRVVTAYAEKIGMGTVTRAELAALRRGLIIAIERKIPRIIIQTDSKVVEAFMKSDMADLLPSAHSHTIQICKSFIEDTEWEMQFTHIYREANSCADWLANLGIDQVDGLKLLAPSELLPGLRRLVELDARGVSWPRMVPVGAPSLLEEKVIATLFYAFRGAK